MIQFLQGWIHQKQSQILPAGSLGARFARGAFWSLMGIVIAQALGMIASIVTTRLLGATGFGEFGMINSTVGTFGDFAGLGLGLTATKHIAEFRTTDPVRAGRLLGLSTLVALLSGGLIAALLFVIAPWLTANTLNAPHLTTELRLGCVLLFFNSLNGLQRGVLAGFEAFKTITRVNFLRGLLNFPFMIAGVWWFGLTGAVTATVLVSIIGWWLNQRALKTECKKAGVISTYQNIGSELSILWNFAFPAFLSGIVVGPFMWLSNTLLVNQPNGYSELGLVNAANQWRTVLLLIPGALSSVLLPMLSSVQGDKPRFDRTMDMSQSIATLVIVPIATVLLLLNGWIMGLYGEEFSAGGSIFVCLIIGFAVSGVSNASGSAIQATGRMWLGAAMNFTWGMVLLGFTAIFVPYLGGLALALGFAFAYVFLTLWGYIYLLLRNLVSKAMLYRVFGSIAFLVGVAIFTQMVSTDAEFLLLPMVLLSLWFSLWVLSPPFIRRRLFSVSIFGEKYAD